MLNMHLAQPDQYNPASSSVEGELNRVVMQHPQVLEQIRAVIEQEVASGNLTQQELNTMVQLATVAVRNPEMYPQIRAFAIKQGLATEQDLPQQYDQGLVFAILLAARAAQDLVGGQDMLGGASDVMPPAGMRGVPAM